MAILFDFDEVMVDINTNALNHINEKLNTNYTIKDVTTWDFYDRPEIRPHFMEFLLIKDMYQKYAILNNKMIGICKQLVEMGEKVFIVTASVEGSHESKAQLIREHMSFFDEANVFVINSTSKYKVKSDVLLELKLNYHEPIVLVDDGVHNILDMMADERHKDKLDNMMEKLYSNKKLKKFNNPYHDFIYGIIPQLPYNQNIVDGKRIFKIQETADFWKVFKNIKKNHRNRISKKQNEIFFYLNELIDDFLIQEDKYDGKKIKLIQNTKYLVDYYLYNNEHKSFLNKLLECSIKIKNVDPQDINQIFEKTEKIFKDDVMYQEIKKLIKLHADMEQSPSDYNLALNYAQYYKISLPEQDLFFKSLLSDLIELSQENLDILANHNIDKTEVLKFLKEKNLSPKDDIDFKANLLKALNENYAIDNCLISKKEETEKFIKTLKFKTLKK